MGEIQALPGRKGSTGYSFPIPNLPCGAASGSVCKVTLLNLAVCKFHNRVAVWIGLKEKNTIWRRASAASACGPLLQEEKGVCELGRHKTPIELQLQSLCYCSKA